MVALSRDRLAPFGNRATIVLNESAGVPPLQGGPFDRFLGTYVLDLLPPDAIQEVLEWAHDLLAPDGLICMVGITKGTGIFSRGVMAAWRLVFELSPGWVGGCRPDLLAESLDPSRWDIDHREVVVAWGIASEVVVARRR
jgi:hypothetical protein